MADPFRDGEDARVATLAQESAELQTELEELRSRLPENNDAFLRRLEQQRDEARAQLARVAGRVDWNRGSAPKVPHGAPLLDLSGRRVSPSTDEPKPVGPVDRVAELEHTNAGLRRDLEAARAALGEDRLAYATWLERDRDEAIAEQRAIEAERAERPRLGFPAAAAPGGVDPPSEKAVGVAILVIVGAIALLVALVETFR